jgi:hypothetical protein
MTKERDDDNILSSVVDPLILEIFLFKNNYKDRLLISELKEKTQTVKIPGTEANSFFVRMDDMIDVLHGKFEKDIIEFNCTSSESLAVNVTSIYFIDSMINTFNQIKYFKINVSDSQIYTRKSNDTINFDYRVIHSKVDFTEFCDPEALEIFRNIFIKVGLFKSEKGDKCPYFETVYGDIVNKLVQYQNLLSEEDEDFLRIEDIFSIFGTKLEKDNPTILVVIEA